MFQQQLVNIVVPVVEPELAFFQEQINMVDSIQIDGRQAFACKPQKCFDGILQFGSSPL